MQIILDNNELEGMRYACAEMNLGYLIVKKEKSTTEVVIRHPSGKDISNTEAYYFCKFMHNYIEREKARLEYESLPIPSASVSWSSDLVEPLP